MLDIILSIFCLYHRYSCPKCGSRRQYIVKRYNHLLKKYAYSIFNAKDILIDKNKVQHITSNEYWVEFCCSNMYCRSYFQRTIPNMEFKDKGGEKVAV